MTTSEAPVLMGIDVAKAELVMARSSSEAILAVPNTAKAIRAWLKTLAPTSCLAVEATNTYHLELIRQAHAQGHTIYVVDGFRLKRYREGVGGRAKTDRSDAQLLLRYLRHEREDLRAWEPPPAGYTTLQRLLRRRASLVKARTALTQSLQGLPELQASLATVLKQLDTLDKRIKMLIREARKAAGWGDDEKRVRAMEGIGEMTGTALTMTFHRGHFSSADAYIAFMGMDVRARDSGTFRGKRKLTKQGDSELRRLLYMAAMAASRSATWVGFYQKALARGKTRIQALVMLGRKLARIAFALLSKGTTYVPKLPIDACKST